MLTALWITKGVLCLPPWRPLAFAVQYYPPRLETGQDCAAATEDLYGTIAVQLGGTMAHKIIETCNAKTHAYRLKRLKDVVTRQRLARHVTRLSELVRTGLYEKIGDEIACELDHQIREIEPHDIPART